VGVDIDAKRNEEVTVLNEKGNEKKGRLYGLDEKDDEKRKYAKRKKGLSPKRKSTI